VLRQTLHLCTHIHNMSYFLERKDRKTSRYSYHISVNIVYSFFVHLKTFKYEFTSIFDTCVLLCTYNYEETWYRSWEIEFINQSAVVLTKVCYLYFYFNSIDN
jgi:hypothetical protein